MKKYIFVDTKGSQALHDAVMAVFRAVNPEIRDLGSKKAGDPRNSLKSYPFLCSTLPVSLGGLFHRSSKEDLISIAPEDITYFDAATQMGEFATAISVKPVTVKDVGEYDAEISPDKKTVKIGCQTVTFEKVREVYEGMLGGKE